MFENLVEVLKANPRKIVYTEGTDARILESAARLKQGGFLTPILVGNVDDVKAAAKAGNFNIEGLEIIDPANYDKMDEMAQCMFDLRKGKMTMEEVRANLQKGNYFGTMLVKMGVADAPARRRDLLHRGHRPSGAAAHQDQEGRPPRELLLHHGPRRRDAPPWATAPSTSTIRIPSTRPPVRSRSLPRRAGRGRHRDRQDRRDLRHRPEGRHAELLHQGLRQGRHGRAQPRRHRHRQGARARAEARRRDAV